MMNSCAALQGELNKLTLNEKYFEDIKNQSDDMVPVPRILLSADRSSSGKTTIMMGILSALVSRGYSVQPFKVGLDYIDPSYHSDITGRKARNIDGYLMDEMDIIDTFVHACKTENGADLAVIEGVRGLYEGLDSLTDTGSTAQVAKILKCPVIFVINARSITRSAAALVNGYRSFDPEVNIAGIILNNVGGERHAKKAKEAIEHYTGLPVVGIVPRDPGMQISMRHLGLIPAIESQQKITEYNTRMEYIQNTINKRIDVDKLIEFAYQAPPVIRAGKSMFKPISSSTEGAVIGVALDEAFNFYYHDNIEMLQAAGANIKYFSPLHDAKIPHVDGIYIGGGYPELFASELEKNTPMKNRIYELSSENIPIYAECGGLMYLTEKITTGAHNSNDSVYNMASMEKATYEMVGALPGHTLMGNKRVVSYNTGILNMDTVIGRSGNVFKGHEFHHSEITDIPEGTKFAIDLSRGEGIINGKDGLTVNNTIGSYAHLHAVSYKEFAFSFVDFIANLM